MMPWLMVVQACVTLWLAWCCLRYAVKADEATAALWQAMAELRMHHNALEAATEDELAAIDDQLRELEPGVIAVAAPPRCTCKSCQARKLAAN